MTGTPIESTSNAVPAESSSFEEVVPRGTVRARRPPPTTRRPRLRAIQKRYSQWWGALVNAYRDREALSILPIDLSENFVRSMRFRASRVSLAFRIRRGTSCHLLWLEQEAPPLDPKSELDLELDGRVVRTPGRGGNRNP